MQKYKFYFYLIAAVLLIPASIALGGVLFYLGLKLFGEFGGVLGVAIFGVCFIKIDRVYDYLITHYEKGKDEL